MEDEIDVLSILFCPNGHGARQGKYCDRCGAELILAKYLEAYKSKYVPHEVSGQESCQCGFKLKHGHQRYCPGCGHELLWTCR